jgi:hypothetical protein
MGNVVPLHQPMPVERLISAIDEITNADTDAVIIIASSPDGVSVRTFGDGKKCRAAMACVVREASCGQIKPA